jgi:hypothetical protein
MVIEYNEERKSVFIDGTEYRSTFQMPTYLRDQFADKEWLEINLFLFRMYNRKDDKNREE